jgi:hypothetical protein
MPFTLDQYSQRWPFLYHLAFRHNLERIRSTMRLESAALLLTAAARQGRIRSRRPEKLAITVEGSQVLLRDQAPLHEANIEFTGGWTFEDLLGDLNRRVFFWPGSESGPNDYGVRHYERYAVEEPIMIRIAFDSLLERNPETTPLFCRFNSGSPRYSQGRPSPRGPDTFLPASQCIHSPRKVVEVTFLESVVLPDETELSDHVGGPWTPLFGTAYSGLVPDHGEVKSISGMPQNDAEGFDTGEAERSVTEFMPSGDELPSRSVARLAEDVARLMRATSKDAETLIGANSLNKVLDVQLLLNQRARALHVDDPERWRLEAASTLLSAIVMGSADRPR